MCRYGLASCMQVERVYLGVGGGGGGVGGLLGSLLKSLTAMDGDGDDE